MAPKSKVLFVLTSQDKMGDTGKPTGWYLVSVTASIAPNHNTQLTALT